MIKIDIDSAKYTRFKDIVNSELTTTPNIIKQEYFNLIELLEVGQIYGALLKIKDCFEVNIKFPVITIMAYYWQKTIMSNLDNKAVNIFADELFKLPDSIQDILLTCAAKKMSFGEWEAACSAINNDSNIKERRDDELLKIFYNINSNNYEVYCNRRNADNNIEYISAWRNETIGHGALNMNYIAVEEDIFEKLEFLTTLLRDNELFYKQITIIFDEEKKQISVNHTVDDCKILITPFMDLLNASNGRMFESFSRKKSEALLMNYSSGQKEKSLTLSQYFTGFSDLLRRIPDNLTPSYKKKKEKQDKSLRDELLSSIKDNTTDKTKDLLLDQKDIDLIQKLKSSEDLNHRNIFCNMFRELMELPEKEEGNIYLLCADRGMGKSTFCRIADELDSMKINNEDDWFTKIDNHQEIIIRAYDCNSFYYSKTKTFLTQLLRAFTSELQYAKNGSPFVVQRINHSDKLLEAFNKLNKAFCEDNKQEERRNAFWQFLAIALNEWSRLKPSNIRLKLVLLIDGIDELVEGQDCLNPSDLLLPEGGELQNLRNIYLIFTCRTQEGNTVWGNIIQNFINSFKQENIRTLTIQDYSSEFITDVTNSFKVSNEKAGEIAKFLDYRYSYFAAYKKIYENMDWSLAEGFNNPFPFYFSYLKRLSNNYLNNVQRVFYLLSIAKDGMTFKELSYMLTGDGDVFPPVDFKLYGMLTDISGFLHYVYDEVRGYVITISHEEWRQRILELQETDKEFAKNVASVKEQVSIRVKSILSREFKDSLNNENEGLYDGELWLLSHLENLNLTIESDRIKYILIIIDTLRGNKLYQKYRAIDILNYCEKYLGQINKLSFTQKRWQTSIYYKRANLYSEIENTKNALEDYTKFINIRKMLENEQQYYSELKYLSKIEVPDNDEIQKTKVNNNIGNTNVVILEMECLQDGYRHRSYLYEALGEYALAENDITNAINALQDKLNRFGDKYSSVALSNYYFQRGMLRKKVLHKVAEGDQDIKFAIQNKVPRDLRAYVPLEQLEIAIMHGELEDNKSLETAKRNFDLLLKSLNRSINERGYSDNLILVEALCGKARVLTKGLDKPENKLFDFLYEEKFGEVLSVYDNAIQNLREFLSAETNGYTKEELINIKYLLINLYIEKAKLYEKWRFQNLDVWKKKLDDCLTTYEQAMGFLEPLNRKMTKEEMNLKVKILEKRASIYFDLWKDFDNEFPSLDSKHFKLAQTDCAEALTICEKLEKLARRGKIALNPDLIDDVYRLKAKIYRFVDTKEAIIIHKNLIERQKKVPNSISSGKHRDKNLVRIYYEIAETLLERGVHENNDLININHYLNGADNLLKGMKWNFALPYLVKYYLRARLHMLEGNEDEALNTMKQGLKLFREDFKDTKQNSILEVVKMLYLYQNTILNSKFKKCFHDRKIIEAIKTVFIEKTKLVIDILSFTAHYDVSFLMQDTKMLYMTADFDSDPDSDN